MDPIILLLASQLLIVAAILLTSSRKNDAKGVGALKPRVFSYVVSALGLRKEEKDVTDGEIDAVELETVRGNTDDGLVIQAKEPRAKAHKDTPKTLSILKQRLKTPKTPKSKEAQMVKQSNSGGMCGKASKAPKSFLSRLSRLVAKIFVAKRVRWLTSFTVKSPFKTSCEEKVVLERPDHAGAMLRVHQSKPIDSDYLMRVILARKTEKAIRLKIIKLNMTIMKARGARPLHAIPELVEQVS